MAGAAKADAATAIPSAIFLILDSPLNLPARLVIPARSAGNTTRTSNFPSAARPTRTVLTSKDSGTISFQRLTLQTIEKQVEKCILHLFVAQKLHFRPSY